MIRRHLQPIVVDSLRHFPVVLLVGARQVGKSTLVQEIAHSEWSGQYLTLDDRTILDAALTNPDGFLQALERPVILDEVQRAPDLLRAVKLIVDRHRQPGMFLLTGSANVLTLAKVSETLAGRVAVHELYPFSWAELAGQRQADFIDRLFTATRAQDVLARRPPRSPAERSVEIQQLILTGGFPPPALMEADSARRTWFDSYRQTYLERDLRDLANIHNLPEFNRLLTMLALRTAQLLNLSEFSRDIGLPVTTLRRYFHLLEQTYQLFLLPPYSANLGKRLIKTPKVYAADTGLACYFSAGDSWQTLVQQNRVSLLVETWVANELRRLLSVASWRTHLSYWRTSTGQEVDFLLERGGEVAGIEVKWGAGFKAQDLAGLTSCRTLLGKRWRFGIFLHNGTEAVAVDEQTLAVPFSVFFGREG